MKNVYIRADGNSKIGLGHLIRCCALAEILHNHFNCTFFVRSPSKYILQEITKVGCTVVNLPETLNYEQEAMQWTKTLMGEEIIVLDGYQFDTVYQELIKSSGCKIVSIDDIHAYPFVSDVIINHAGGVKPSDYITADYTKLCLGFNYALLRSCFLKAFLHQSNLIRKDKNVLVCLGGADPENDTLDVLDTAAKKYPMFHYDIVLGGAYQYKHELMDYISNSTLDFKIHEKLNAEEMLHLMQQASKAICSPSSISIEYLATGGDLYLKKIADNQQEIYEYYLFSRLGFDIDQFVQPSTSFNKNLSSEIFDGRQEQRLLTIFQDL